MKVKEESEKVGLKLNIQKTKIMASGPITSWEIDEETMETVSKFILQGLGASLVSQMVKHLSAMQETHVRSLCWEDSLEKAMASHSSTLSWKILWTEKTGRLQSMWSRRVGQD